MAACLECFFSTTVGSGKAAMLTPCMTFAVKKRLLAHCCGKLKVTRILANHISDPIWLFPGQKTLLLIQYSLFPIKY